MSGPAHRFLLAGYKLLLGVCTASYCVSGDWPWAAAVVVVAFGGVLLAVLTVRWAGTLGTL